jgi:hypothetical protein
MRSATYDCLLSNPKGAKNQISGRHAAGSRKAGGQSCRFIAIKLVSPGFGRKVDLLREHRLLGVRLPPFGAFPLLLFPALQCRGRIGGPETDVNKEQKEQSYDHGHRKNSVSHIQRAESPEINT